MQSWLQNEHEAAVPLNSHVLPCDFALQAPVSAFPVRCGLQSVKHVLLAYRCAIWEYSEAGPPCRETDRGLLNILHGQGSVCRTLTCCLFSDLSVCAPCLG